ncbi:hypothetical protein MEG_00536 [Bartonella tamiae Th307]|uniref:Uncharacterized protein n=1 Tax=Bartonella tamiae Th239 TaxID=1094558 RepID=J1JW39_9HYPH|nr:hypothetical protein ME5_01346 [Bartonella tamiae Th239]EJF94955.1 hypothetical protein MEG_00536 [Bartonella tamiae Th307]
MIKVKNSVSLQTYIYKVIKFCHRKKLFLAASNLHVFYNLGHYTSRIIYV